MSIKTLVRVAMTAAIYTVVTLVLAPLSYGNLQVRIAEALTMLPILWKPSIAGVTLGCFLSNLIGASMGINPTGYLDAVVGTIATFLAAWCTWKFRNIRIGKIPVLSAVMPAVWNFFFVGTELAVLYMPDHIMMGILINGTWVAIGELIAAVLGLFLIRALDKLHLFD